MLAERPVRVLSGIQPWWFIVIHLGKEIENRRKPVLGLDYLGDVLLHASKSKGKMADQQNWAAARGFVAERFGEALAARIPPIGYLPMGGIVGRATVTGVVRPMTTEYPGGVDKRWHMRESYGYLLKDPQETPFVPWRGAQAAVEAPAVLLAALARQAALSGTPYRGTCARCGREALLVGDCCANQSICQTGQDGPDHYP